MPKQLNVLALLMCRGDTQPSKHVEYFQIQIQLYKLPLQQAVHSSPSPGLHHQPTVIGAVIKSEPSACVYTPTLLLDSGSHRVAMRTK